MTADDSPRRSRRGRWIERFLTRRVADRPAAGPAGLLEVSFGPLELRVLDALWRRADEAGVRAIEAEFPGTAYTTLMTTLDRLFKKDLLVRRKVGRAYRYAPRYGRAELEALLARDAVEELLDGARPGRGPLPVLSGFVEAVGRRDAQMLDELERLVREHQTATHRRRKRNGGEE
ncbi:MAG TPA: BlaI/MecI/CopY family transcriptional regulator [Candidatus Polarisedimenticolaceae bacterium]|nr:BlaI/MecI/CopY family transcriptional regulator [Candidatus Polarisedimenticolaceae bacterium]